MANKPFFNKSFLDIYKSTKRGYPPKDTKLFWADNFLAGEHFNKANFGPLKDGFNLGNNPCSGRVLRPASQVEWASGEGGQPKDGDVKEFQTEVSGAVGNVIYYMDPFWDDINDAGDKATIDETGLITLEEGVCQGPYPPWIIYWVCDDCGCSSGTIWLEDSSGDCDPCATCDCEDTESDCYAECCSWTESGTPEEMDFSDTKQFTCSGGGDWSITGADATIDQTGLVTTGASSCGTLVITNSICGDKEVRVQGNGSEWVMKSQESCLHPPDITPCVPTAIAPTVSLGGFAFRLDSGKTRTEASIHCVSDVFFLCDNPPGTGGVSVTCANCGVNNIKGVYSVTIREWECP
jgi:hypothetical protein